MVLLGKTGLNTHKCQSLEAGSGSLTIFIGNNLSWNQVAVLDNYFLCNLNLLFHIHDIKGSDVGWGSQIPSVTFPKWPLFQSHYFCHWVVCQARGRYWCCPPTLPPHVVLRVLFQFSGDCRHPFPNTMALVSPESAGTQALVWPSLSRTSTLRDQGSQTGWELPA